MAKMPRVPPDIGRVFRPLQENPGRLLALITAVSHPSVHGKYLHWDELVHRAPPADLSHEEWWLALKTQRRGLYKTIPLEDKEGQCFHYTATDPIPERLHYIDLGAGGLIEMPGQITNPGTKDRYYIGSLIEEAVTSSQLEGATTTRQVAKEMLRTGRTPQDVSEQMILNNFLTMKRIGELKQRPLTPELVFEIHELVTTKTLRDPSAAGRFRASDEPVCIVDDRDRTVHAPPPAEQLGRRMDAMCKFANAEEPFIHPVIRSIILHFWLAYDHPFVDGNGRTARALFYWSMLHHSFWLFEFISISSIIRKGPARYSRAFLYTETDENDLTYFLIYHLDVIRRAIEQLHEYIARKTRQLQAVEAQLRSAPILNYRQRVLLGHALRHPRHRYTIQSHRVSHNVVYQTARRDLLELAERGLLDAAKIGRTWHFTPADDLEKKLSQLA